MFLLWGCGEQIEVENLPATLVIEDVILHQASSQSARRPALSYTLSDPEGDDQYLEFLVCDGQGLKCGYPIQARGSDGSSFVPTRIDGSPAPHFFLWDASCGRIELGGRKIIPSTLEETYTFIAFLEDAASGDRLSSRAFSFKGLGLEALAPCSR